MLLCRSMFWPFNIHSCKRNGELHPSINVDYSLGTSQHHIGATNSNTDTSGYIKMASQVQKQLQCIPAEYEIPIKSPSPKTSKAPVPIPDTLDINAIYEMPTVPNQTAYLTEDFKKRPT